ncbi:hypothetical protein PCC7418_0920 [Halothece sp. PCC 7418]|uniref:hypothetical protein n=1 Tax=Halothece sp. (strain PCC 7418) TaxID=65093 RepID=UPI0002A07694|nr:hypothetical protein [Halothece sp. PCC 7418]AFZ43130.1 hypothetical protein PCC7418_0920 [Halothece sp. PCC 7418]
MTRLFNLESYPNCCQDAYLFEKSIKDLSPEENSLPLNYKRFLENHQHYPYLPQPLFVDELPDSLTFNPHPPSPQHLGEEVTDGEDKQLFIIPDTIDLMTLSSRGIFGFNESYLYRSAYLYWNYVSQLPQLGENQRLVLIDLDSFHPQQLLPLRLESHSNSSYPIPILDQQSNFQLKISEEVKSNYDRIIESLSHYFLETHFPQRVGNPSAIAHLSHYLKKQAFLQQLSSVNSSPRQILLEINTGENLIYKTITVSPDEIRNIITETVNLSALERLSNHHRDHIFVIVSHWNNFLSRENSNLVYINPDESQFGKVLAEKATNEFPLFGIALDRIQYQVRIKNEAKWIQLTNSDNNISYEGNPQTLQGIIPETQQKEFFISQTQPNHLPIQVNGKNYLIDGKPQDYVIEVKNPQGEENIKITFEFQITPGKTPKLNVNCLDSSYKITSYLDQRLRQTIYYYYLPSEKILDHREDKSTSQINDLKKDSRFQEFYNKTSNILSQNRADLSATKLNPISQQMGKGKNNNLELFQYINPNSDGDFITKINRLVLDKVNLIIETTKSDLEEIHQKYSQKITNKQRRQLNSFTKDIVAKIKYIGKLYQFSKHFDLTDFFLQENIINSQKITQNNLHDEYLQFLARTATKMEYQKQYFSLFNEYYQLINSQYLWGYGRILLWYYNFKQPNLNIINYRDHFISISNFIMDRNNTLNEQYLQNAFLALIYLLTFSEHDSNFFTENSEERKIAQKLVSHYQSENIILRQVPIDKSLNEIFSDLITGKATEKEIIKLVELA